MPKSQRLMRVFLPESAVSYQQVKIVDFGKEPRIMARV
jgi:hypothetical protein